ncbi:hypothetical protein, partial [Pseudoalteromonas luteoviolacea]
IYIFYDISKFASLLKMCLSIFTFSFLRFFRPSSINLACSNKVFELFIEAEFKKYGFNPSIPINHDYMYSIELSVNDETVHIWLGENEEDSRPPWCQLLFWIGIYVLFICGFKEFYILLKLKRNFNMTDDTSVKNAINAFYKGAGLNLTFKGDVNDRVAKVFGEMIFATQKCTTALNWVPRPSGGKATISWVVKNFSQSVLRQIESKQSLTCAKEVVRNYRTKLQIAASGI